MIIIRYLDLHFAPDGELTHPCKLCKFFRASFGSRPKSHVLISDASMLPVRLHLTPCSMELVVRRTGFLYQDDHAHHVSIKLIIDSSQDALVSLNARRNQSAD